jgi:hypothetical protein
MIPVRPRSPSYFAVANIVPELQVEPVQAVPVYKWDWPLNKKIWCLAILTHLLSTTLAAFAVIYVMTKCKCN